MNVAHKVQLSKKGTVAAFKAAAPAPFSLRQRVRGRGDAWLLAAIDHRDRETIPRKY